MRILFLLPSVPLPADAGAKLRNLALLRLAGADHEVDALAFGEGDGLGQFVRRAATVAPPAPRPALQRVLHTLRSPLPDIALRLWSPRFAVELSAALEREWYDLVQAEGIEMGRYLLTVPSDRRVYDAHNPEALLQRRAWHAAARRRDLASAAYSWLQWRRLTRFEAGLIASCRRILAVSYHDANQLEALAPTTSDRIRVVPSALDVTAFPFCQPSADQADNLLFLGRLDYRPNAEGVKWLIDLVLPRLFERKPKARLFVVGPRPPGWLVAAGQRDDRIAVTGHVIDERPYLKRAAALLLPLEVAAGSRLKALVALASGVPIVSTALGMEGLEAVPGEHYEHAVNLCPQAWANVLARLLDDPVRRSRLALNGRRLVEACYDWSAVAPALRAAYAL